MKFDWEQDKVYRHADVAAGLEGGFPRDYLPHNRERVFAACLTQKKNPEAPDVVLVGRAPSVVRAGEVFSRQQTPVPTFVRIDTNQWLFKGMYRVTEVISENAEVARLARKAKRSDVAFALRLKKVEQTILPAPLALDDIVQSIVAPLRLAKGQGRRGLSGPERRLVELEAMRRARQWLTEKGFKFKDVSAEESCDFRAARDGEEWVIEVKGTTGGPESILLTPNEVALHRSKHPRNALLIVHGIKLSDDGTDVLRAGDLLAIAPWAIDEEHLKPVCYEYRLN
jgi:hypothetical protein